MKKHLAALTLTAALAAPLAIAAATPATALNWKCTTSSHSIDDPAYWGPWPDNYDIAAALCSARSGSTVYAYAKLKWDGPTFATANDSSIFDGAYFQLQIRKSVPDAPDPVVRAANYNIESLLEHSNSWGHYSGSYTTPTITVSLSSAKGYTDGVLRLDWNNDGADYQPTWFSPSAAS